MDKNLPNMQELSQKAEGIYQKILPEINKMIGKYVAIELESEEYFVGETREDAVANARQKFSNNKLLFVRRIGTIEKISTHVCPIAFPGRESFYACLL
jgi:hypothetical protein